MVKTETEIANMALYHIGATPIANLNGQDPKTKTVAQFYKQAIEEVLRDYDWGSATRRQELAEVSGDATDFEYRYALPSDPYCLRVLSVYNPDDGISVPNDFYNIEGRELLSNLTPLGVKYIALLDDVDEYDSQFVAAVSYKLASYLAFPITKKPGMRTEMLQIYASMLLEAKSITGREIESDGPYPTRWGDIRSYPQDEEWRNEY